ncbi:MAG: glycosyltransferase family 39 protein [Vicinamibacterales bacterium]
MDLPSPERPGQDARGRLVRCLPLIIVMVAGGLRAAALGRPVWLDEASTLRFAAVGTLGEWLRVLAADGAPPLFPALFTAWAAPSTDVYWLRGLPWVFGTATVALAQWWIWPVSRVGALCAGLLVATSPLMLRYSAELRAYSVLMCAVVATYAAAWRFQREPHRPADRWWFAGALTLACSTHMAAVLMIPAAAAFLLAAQERRSLRRLPRPAFGIAGAAWGLMAMLQHRLLRHVLDDWWMPTLGWDLAWRSAMEVVGAAPPGVEASIPIRVVTLGLIVAAAGTLVVAERRAIWTAPLMASLVYLGGLAAASVVGGPVWWPRTLLPGVLGLLMSVGAAVGCLRPGRSRAAAASAVVAVSTVLGARWMVLDAQRPIEPWDQVASALAPASTSPIVVVPAYAAWPLGEQLSASDRQRLVPVQDGAVPPFARPDGLRSGLPAASLVVRIDGALRVEALLPALEALAAAGGPVRAVLLMAPDVSLDPRLAVTRATVEERLRERLGEPASVSRSAPIEVLDFGRAVP